MTTIIERKMKEASNRLKDNLNSTYRHSGEKIRDIQIEKLKKGIQASELLAQGIMDGFTWSSTRSDSYWVHAHNYVWEIRKELIKIRDKIIEQEKKQK